MTKEIKLSNKEISQLLEKVRESSIDMGISGHFDFADLLTTISLTTEKLNDKLKKQ